MNTLDLSCKWAYAESWIQRMCAYLGKTADELDRLGIKEVRAAYGRMCETERQVQRTQDHD